MNQRVVILIAAWIAMGFAFHFQHAFGYTIVLLGLAATFALAVEDLRTEPQVASERQTEAEAVPEPVQPHSVDLRLEGVKGERARRRNPQRSPAHLTAC